MKIIPTYRKKEVVSYSLIDDEDFDKVNQYRWNLSDRGYAENKSKMIKLHRLIMNFPDCDIDHIDHNPLNNQKLNLRLCNKIQNGRNRLKTKKKTTSKYKGVCWNKNKNKWQANIRNNKKLIYLGLFNSELDAAKSYNKAALEYFGEFALLNKIGIAAVLSNTGQTSFPAW